MHCIYFVLVDSDTAKTSEQARVFTHSMLQEEGFVDGGYFGGGIADWFVIGGRWSGELQAAKLGIDFDTVAEMLIHPKSDFGLSTDEIEAHGLELQKAWTKAGGQGTHPYSRDSYQEYGYDDDAIILDTALAENLKRKWKDTKDIDVFNHNDYDTFNLHKLTEEHNGNWLVVVDYHS